MLSKARYELYCGATTYTEAIGLGIKSEIKTGDAYYDLDHGYLQIFPRCGPRRWPRRTRRLRAARNPEKGL